MMKHLIVVFACVLLSEGVKLPANFIKCNRKEPDLNGCLLKASQNGIAQLTKPFDKVNLPNLEPMEVAEITVGAGKGPVNVDQHFKNCKLYGLSKLQVTKLEMDFDKKGFYVAGIFPEIKLNCDYELDGQVLILPVVGKGPSTVIIKDVKASVFLNFEEVIRKGKAYFKITSSELTLDPGFASFNFENLFNGDKRLGDEINNVLNENWKEVFNDVKSGYEEVFNRVCRGLFDNFFNKVSVEEAFD